MNDAETLFLQGYEYYREAANADDLRKAFELLGAASSMGHALAQDILGNMYEDGDGAPLDINTAVGLYRRSAEQDCPQGMYDLALLHLDGHGVETDEARAFKLIEKAVEIGGDPEHMFMLSVLYLHGRGVEQDSEKALSLLRAASREGSVDAKANLGAMHLAGDQVPRDLPLAFRLLSEAASEEDCSAMCNLGLMYETGAHVGKDIQAALLQYRRAADLGYPPAYYHLGVLAGSGEVDMGEVDRVGLLETAGAMGEIEALHRLAQMYYFGDGVEADADMASQFFRAGVEFDNPECMYDLAVMIIRGEASSEYDGEEYDLLLAAADAGYGPAVELVDKSSEES